jgi:hypothetical protein
MIDALLYVKNNLKHVLQNTIMPQMTNASAQADHSRSNDLKHSHNASVPRGQRGTRAECVGEGESAHHVARAKRVTMQSNGEKNARPPARPATPASVAAP